MSVTNSQAKRVHHHKTNSYQQSPTSGACISKVARIRYKATEAEAFQTCHHWWTIFL